MNTLKSFLLKKNLWKLGLFLMVIIVIGMGLQWITYERQPLPEALAALTSDQVVTVSQKPWLTFSPNGVSPTTGFIFYPGGRISYLGYSDFMKSIAAQGYLVVVPQMPFNIAAANPDVAGEIITAHPEIAHWVIGGHSVGGTMAAQYTYGHPQFISGLVIWASYPADNANISNLNLPVALIYGTLDRDAGENSVMARRHLLPVNTMYVRIEGGDHHQFGSYALTTEEHLATLNREAQQKQIVEATLQVLAVTSK